MYQQLETFLTSQESFSTEELHTIVTHFKPMKVKRNEILCNIGDLSYRFFFINKGCLRLYEIDQKGNDITGYFALEDSLFTALPSFILQKPSRDVLIAIEPSDLLVIGRDSFFKLVQQFPSFKTVYTNFIQFAFIHSQMRIYSFLGMEGIDKLKWVMEHEPKLLGRVSSKAVASYLGMTNSTLSKLKAKL